MRERNDRCLSLEFSLLILGGTLLFWSVGCLEFDDVHASSSLMPTRGIYTALERENNPHRTQGSWYSYTDMGKSRFTKNPIETIKRNRFGTEQIVAEGEVTHSETNKEGWGVGFGLELCLVDSDDIVDTGNSESEVDSRWQEDFSIPLANEYPYPIGACPFNKTLHKEFKGVELELDYNGMLGFGVLEVQFKLTNNSLDDYPSCWVFEGKPYAGVRLCEVTSVGDRRLRIRALVDNAFENYQSAEGPSDIRAVHIQVKSTKRPATRAFGFRILKVDGLFGRGSTDAYKDVQDDSTILLSVDEMSESPISDSDWFDFGLLQIQRTEVTIAHFVSFYSQVKAVVNKRDIPRNNWNTCGVQQYYDAQPKPWPIPWTNDDLEKLISSSTADNDKRDLISNHWPDSAGDDLVKKKEDISNLVTLSSMPANCINYMWAEGFCTWLGGRLPTMEEWMEAARVVQSIKGHPALSCVNTVMTNEDGHACGKYLPQRVCSKESDNSLPCDLFGNLSEWTSSTLDKQTYRVLKGGSLYSEPEALQIDSMSIEHTSNPYHLNRLGFRCVRAKEGVVPTTDGQPDGTI